MYNTCPGDRCVSIRCISYVFWQEVQSDLCGSAAAVQRESCDLERQVVERLREIVVAAMNYIVEAGHAGRLKENIQLIGDASK